MPPSRVSCSRSTCTLRLRAPGRDACCQSQPPHRPGTASGHGGVTRSARGGRAPRRCRPAASACCSSVTRSADPLSRQCPPDEDDPAVRRVSHAITAGADPLHGQLEQLAGVPRRAPGHATGSRGSGASRPGVRRCASRWPGCLPAARPRAAPDVTGAGAIVDQSSRGLRTTRAGTARSSPSRRARRAAGSSAAARSGCAAGFPTSGPTTYSGM